MRGVLSWGVGGCGTPTTAVVETQKSESVSLPRPGPGHHFQYVGGEGGLASVLGRFGGLFGGRFRRLGCGNVGFKGKGLRLGRFGVFCGVDGRPLTGAEVSGRGGGLRYESLLGGCLLIKHPTNPPRTYLLLANRPAVNALRAARGNCEQRECQVVLGGDGEGGCVFKSSFELDACLSCIILLVVQRLVCAVRVRAHVRAHLHFLWLFAAFGGGGCGRRERRVGGLGGGARRRPQTNQSTHPLAPPQPKHSQAFRPRR